LKILTEMENFPASRKFKKKSAPKKNRQTPRHTADLIRSQNSPSFQLPVL